MRVCGCMWQQRPNHAKVSAWCECCSLSVLDWYSTVHFGFLRISAMSNHVPYCKWWNYDKPSILLSWDVTGLGGWSVCGLGQGQQVDEQRDQKPNTTGPNSTWGRQPLQQTITILRPEEKIATKMVLHLLTPFGGVTILRSNLRSSSEHSGVISLHFWGIVNPWYSK